MPADRLRHRGRSEGEVDFAGLTDPAGRGRHRDEPVHRVGRLEPERDPPGATERLAQLLEYLVRPVGRPDLIGPQPEAGVRGQVVGEVRAKRLGLAVGVPVGLGGRERRGFAHGVDQTGGRRVRVLVGVEQHRNVELRGAVGHLAA